MWKVDRRFTEDEQMQIQWSLIAWTDFTHGRVTSWMTLADVEGSDSYAIERANMGDPRSVDELGAPSRRYYGLAGWDHHILLFPELMVLYSASPSALMRNATTHEVGHVLGFRHFGPVSDPMQVMTPTPELEKVTPFGTWDKVQCVQLGWCAP